MPLNLIPVEPDFHIEALIKGNSALHCLPVKCKIKSSLKGKCNGKSRKSRHFD